MTRHRLLATLACCLALAPSIGLEAADADADFLLDSRITLDAYRAVVEARVNGALTATRTLAVTQEVRSGDWSRMRPPLAVLAAGLGEQAAVWYMRADGSYFTVERGLMGETLRDRDYFPALVAGREVAGALVISKSTGKRSVVVASPILVDGKAAGAVGVSIDAAKLAASIDQAIRFPPDVVFYALDSQGRTALHRAGDLIFVFPSDVGSATLSDAVKTMLGKPEGVVRYQYKGDKTAIFERSERMGWVFVLGRTQGPDAKQ